nr:MAG TPA: hypothetical protein [Caudoviricetes sp.]
MTLEILIFSTNILPQGTIFVNMQRLFCAKLSERAGLQNIFINRIFHFRSQKSLFAVR